MMHWFSIWLEVVSFNKNKAMFVSKEVKRKVEETPLLERLKGAIRKQLTKPKTPSIVAMWRKPP